jgi:hypothetical protein
MSLKPCSRCGVLKTLGKFYSNSHSPDGRRSTCIACHKHVLAHGYKKHGRNQSRDTAIKRLRQFGITPDEYNTMFLAQGGVCAICGKHQKQCKRSLAVDHCHHSGRIRGLLCMSCNTKLGWYERHQQLIRHYVEE